MSEQALYRLLRLFYKSRSALMPLLLLSKSQPLRWVVIWFGQILWITASILFGLRMSEQALYRLLRLFYKSRSALMPLLLLSKSQPLRWVVIWFGQILWITASILFGLRMSEQALYRLLRLFYKSRSALMPLLLLSKSQPLRWVVIWFGQIRFKESSKAQWKVAKLPHRLCLFISMCHLLSQMA